jgi:hypothetical protein
VACSWIPPHGDDENDWVEAQKSKRVLLKYLDMIAGGIY